MDVKRFHVKEAKPLDGFKVALRFCDGTERIEDLSRFLQGPLFAEIRHSSDAFASLKIDGGTVSWENGADIDPVVLYFGSAEKAEEQIGLENERTLNFQR